MWPGSGYEDWFLVEDAVFEHAVDHVASAAREADDGGVVALALFAFALVVGDGRRVFGGRDERGLPQRVLEAFVAPSGGSLALDCLCSISCCGLGVVTFCWTSLSVWSLVSVPDGFRRRARAGCVCP